MYDKKGRRSKRRNIYLTAKQQAKEQAKARALENIRIARAKERAKALEVPKTTLVKARRPTEDAPTRAEQERSIKRLLENAEHPKQDWRVISNKPSPW